jgi:hypothetical protein
VWDIDDNHTISCQSSNTIFSFDTCNYSFSPPKHCDYKMCVSVALIPQHCIFRKVYVLYYIFLTINIYYVTILYQSVCIIMQNVNCEAENNSLNTSKMGKNSDLRLFTWK